MVKDDKLGYSEMGDCLLGSKNVYSSENLRKSYYVLEKVAENINGDCVITDNDILKEIEKQKDELFKERVKLRDKQREINKVLYEESRFENLREVLINSLSDMPKLNPIKKTDYEPKENLEASLLISDVHMGIKIDNQFNYYDVDVAQDRLNQVISKTIYYCQLHKVQKLNVEILGDIISGIIQVTGRVEQEEDIITQVITAGEMLVNVLLELDKYIPEVCVWTVFGNHSRVTPNKKENLNRENFERLIYHHIKTRLPNMKIATSLNDDFLTYKIGNKTIVLTHGDKDSAGTAVSNFENLLNIKASEIHLGHYHSFMIKDNNDTDIVVNGSIVGTDDYAISIRKSTKPSQTLRIYDMDTCTYKIIVD